MTINPYESPEAAPSLRPNSFRLGAPEAPFVDGKLLVVRSRTAFPPVCVRTNRPVGERDMVRRYLYWCSPAVWLLLFFSPFVLFFGYLMLRKECQLVFGMEPRIRNRFGWLLLGKVLLCVGLLGGVVLGVRLVSLELTIASMLLLFASVVLTAVGNSPLSIAQHRDGLFWIRGCSPEFLAAIEQSMRASAPPPDASPSPPHREEHGIDCQ